MGNATKPDKPRSMKDVIIECEASLMRYVMTFFAIREDVEEVVHDAYLKALTAEKNTDISAPRAYLFRIAKHVALNRKARQKKVYFENIEDFHEIAVDEKQPNADDDLYWKNMQKELGEAISALPPQCRKVFVLQRLQGMSYKEISAKLGISVRTVEKHLEKALVRCAQHLEKGGYDDWGTSNVRSLKKYLNR